VKACNAFGEEKMRLGQKKTNLAKEVWVTV